MSGGSLLLKWGRLDPDEVQAQISEDFDSTLTYDSLEAIQTNYDFTDVRTKTAPPAIVGEYITLKSFQGKPAIRLLPYGAENIEGGGPGEFIEVVGEGEVSLYCYSAGSWAVFSSAHPQVYRHEKKYSRIEMAAVVSRKTVYLSSMDYFDPTGAVAQDTTLLQARDALAAISGKKQLVIPPGLYKLTTPRNLFALMSDLEIIMEGAEFIVDVGVSTSGWDLVATDVTQFDNAIFYSLLPNIDNFKTYGGLFNIGPTQLAAIQIGDSVTHTSGAVTNGGIILDGLKQVGGNQLQLHSLDDVLIRDLRQEFTHSTALSLSNCRSAKVINPSGSHIGVLADKSVWNNVAAISGTQAMDVSIISPRYEYSGGTCILFRASGSGPIRRMEVIDPGLTACGKSAVEFQIPDFAAANTRVEQAAIRGGYIKGYQCQPNDQDHAGLQIAIALAGGATIHQATIEGTQVDYLSPDETFNETTFDVSGGYNALKAKAGNVGSTYGAQISGIDTNSIIHGGTIVNVNVKHAKNSGILLDHVAGGVVAKCVTDFCGYGRDGADTPLTSAHGIFVNACAESELVGNVVKRNNPGCVGSLSTRTQMIRVVDSYDIHVHGNTLRGNDTAVAATQWNHAPIGFSGSAFAALAGYTGRTCSVRVGRNNIYGSYFGLTPNGGGHVLRQGGSTGYIIIDGDEYIGRPTGSTACLLNSTIFFSHAGAAIVPTIPPAAESPGHVLTLVHLGLSVNIATVTPTAGTIGGAANVVMAAGAFKTYKANGADWCQIA